MRHTPLLALVISTTALAPVFSQALPVFDFPESIERTVPEVARREVRVSPGESIEATVATAAPGDSILLQPGTYHQTTHIAVSGTEAAPIIIRAETPGTVLVSGAPQGLSLDFERVEGDLYRTSVPHHVRWVMADGRNLIGYESLEGLAAFTITGHDSRRPEPGPPEGFAWEDGALYVRLLGGKDAGEADIEIHRDYPEANAELSATDYWGKPFRDRETGGELFRIDGDHVVLSGLRMRLAPEAAVRASGEGVTVEDCLIEGSFRGILAGEAPDLTVRNCEFGCYPGYQWVRWGQVKYPQNRNALWNAVYNSNLCATFLNHSGPGAVVRSNLVYEAFDGIQRHAHDRGRPVDMSLASEFAYNAILSCGDECIEFDSTGPQLLRVHHNFFMDALALLALSPVQGGHLMIDHNIAYVSPEYGLMPCTMLKFDCPWREARIDTPTHDCTIVHNTVVNGRTYLYWTGEDHSFVDNVVGNNIFWVRLSFPYKLADAGLTIDRRNLYAGPNVSAEHLPGVLQAAEGGFVGEPTVIPLRTPRLPVIPMIGLESPDPETPTVDRPIDFHLRADSPAIDAGAWNPRYHHDATGRGPDLGALELGETWDFPRPGPRWAVGEMTPWRSPLPGSVEPKWVGLD